jgi:hypothetical protein
MPGVSQGGARSRTAASDDAALADSSSIVSPAPRGPALWHLARSPEALSSARRIVWPTVYLSAACEVVLLTLVVSLLMTYGEYPTRFDSNPLKDRLGYNSPWLGVDVAPGARLAAVGFTLAAAFAWRHADLHSDTPPRSAPGSKALYTGDEVAARPAGSGRLVTWSAFLFACSVSVLPLLASYGAADGRYDVHAALFCQFMVARLLAVLATHSASSAPRRLLSSACLVLRPATLRRTHGGRLVLTAPSSLAGARDCGVARRAKPYLRRACHVRRAGALTLVAR